MKKILFLICIVAMGLAACGGATSETPDVVPAPAEPQTTQGPISEPTAEPAAEEERTTVRFAAADWNRPLYEEMISAFEEENPDIEIEVVSVNEVLELGPIGQMAIPDDADKRLVAAADIVNISVTRDAVRDGLVRDLTPFLDSDPNFRADDFYPGLLESQQWQGGTWALPTSANYLLILYNKDAFDEAGESYPRPGWTWEDLLSKAVALTKGEGEEVARWGFVPAGVTYRLIESHAGGLADHDADPPATRYDDADIVEAVRWYADLYRENQVMPYFGEGEDEDLLSQEQALVDKGMAAMWPETDIAWWYRNEQANVGTVPFPADRADSPSSPAAVSTLAMSAGTGQPEAAWRFMEYLSRQAIATMSMGMKPLPARQSAAETSGYWDDLDESYAAAMHYAIDNAYMMQPPVSYDAFDEALQAILDGAMSVEDALAEAQSQAEAEILEAVLEREGATPVPTFVVAQPESEPEAEGAITITFIPGLGSLFLEPYRDLADQFHQANPDIVVEVKMLDLASGAPSIKSLAENVDCFQWYPSFHEPENREAILNLDPFVDADPAFSTDDYYPQVLEQFTWQGQLWALPAEITPFVFEYNKDLFDDLGIDYPEADWTWEDFLALTVDLTEGEEEKKRYGFSAEVYEINDLLLISERLGAKLLDDTLEPPALSFNDPETVEAVRWYAGLTTEHGIKPVFITDLSNLLGANAAVMEREAMINDGRSGLWTGSATTVILFGARGDMNVGAIALPARADGSSKASYLGTTGYFVSAEADDRGNGKSRACWEWITYLGEQPAAMQGLPARYSVATSDEYRAHVGAERASAYLASVGDSEQPAAFQTISGEEWLGGAAFWFAQAFGQIIEGEASVEDALDAAQKLADDYRACVVAANDFSQASWEACLKEVDPTLPDYLFMTGE